MDLQSSPLLKPMIQKVSSFDVILSSDSQYCHASGQICNTVAECTCLGLQIRTLIPVAELFHSIREAGTEWH